MGSLTNGGEVLILDYYFGASANTTPSSWFIGLSTTTITDAGGNITEVAGNGYARSPATNNKTTFTPATGGALSNAIVLPFPQATGSWGTVTDFFLANSSTASATANIWGYGVLTTPKAITTGDTASFSIGSLAITLD